VRLPTLSVVIPVYNEAADLPTCLDFLLAQEKEILEILVVDNNSSDNSVKIAKDIAKIHPKVKILHQKIQGIVPTRNLGFEKANGDIISRIDADTHVAPSWARAIREDFARYPDTAALDGQTHFYDLPFDHFTMLLNKFVVSATNKFAGGSNSLYGPNMAIRADVARKLAVKACTHRRMMEDLDLTIHLRRWHARIRRNEQMLAYISGRRLAGSPRHIWDYNKMWPNTYRLHGQKFATWFTTAIIIWGFPGQTLIILPIRAYNPQTRHFSWRYLQKGRTDRINP
jgi:glycosyltransferase involved in cell wall biosynthesis